MPLWRTMRHGDFRFYQRLPKLKKAIGGRVPFLCDGVPQGRFCKKDQRFFDGGGCFGYGIPDFGHHSRERARKGDAVLGVLEYRNSHRLFVSSRCNIGNEQRGLGSTPVINVAVIGLLVGIASVFTLGILSARLSHSKRWRKTGRIGYSPPLENRDPRSLNRDNPDAMKLAEGGSSKNKIPLSSTGR
jgi:hypothetical protein